MPRRWRSTRPRAANSTSQTFSSTSFPTASSGAFTQGEILQVLLLAILCGVALASLDKEKYVVGLAHSLSHVFFKIIAIVMETAPLGAFGAMAFTVGKYGLVTLLSLAKLMACVYVTSIAFVAIVLGTICYFNGINLWRFLSTSAKS